MISTTPDRLINVGLLKLDTVDEGYFSSYYVPDGYVLMTTDDERITLVQILHDSDDLVVVITEGNPDYPLNLKPAQPISIRIYKEVDTIGWPL